MDEAKNQINDVKHKGAENNQSEQHKETIIQKTVYNISSLWDNFVSSNIHIIGVPEGEKQKETGNLFEKNKERKIP